MPEPRATSVQAEAALVASPEPEDWYGDEAGEYAFREGHVIHEQTRLSLCKHLVDDQDYLWSEAAVLALSCAIVPTLMRPADPDDLDALWVKAEPGHPEAGWWLVAYLGEQPVVKQGESDV